MVMATSRARRGQCVKQFQSSCWSQVLKALTWVYNKPAVGKRKWLFDFQCFFTSCGYFNSCKKRKKQVGGWCKIQSQTFSYLSLSGWQHHSNISSLSLSLSLRFSVYINEIRLLTLFLLLLDLFLKFEALQSWMSPRQQKQLQLSSSDSNPDSTSASRF